MMGVAKPSLALRYSVRMGKLTLLAVVLATLRPQAETPNDFAVVNVLRRRS